MIALFCLALSGAGIAQKPETVYGIAKDLKEESWYLTQQKLWKAEIDKDKTNADAWYNYYKATRALRNTCPKEKRKEYADLCTKIVEDAQTAIPNTFEANHLKWADGGNTLELFPYLKKAYDINPEDPRTYEDLATYYEIRHNKAEYTKACKLMYTANTVPPSIVNWAYNMLAETDQNAILLTGGDNDTYSAWVMQEAKNFRKDVRVVNMHLMMIDDYRNQLFKELGMPALDVKVGDDWTHDEYVSKGNQIIGHFFKNSQKHPVYVAVSAVESLKGKWADSLFLTGLTYRYSPETFDNTAIILRNYEHRYLLDHLHMSFGFAIGEKICDNINGCYLPSMMKLYQHYTMSEQTAKAEDMKQLMLAVGEKSGQREEVVKCLNTEY